MQSSHKKALTSATCGYSLFAGVGVIWGVISAVEGEVLGMSLLCCVFEDEISAGAVSEDAVSGPSGSAACRVSVEAVCAGKGAVGLVDASENVLISISSNVYKRRIWQSISMQRQTKLFTQ